MQQTFSAVLPLKRRARLDPTELITEIRLLVEQTGAVVRLDPRTIHQRESRPGLLSMFSSGEPQSIMLELDGVRLKIAQYDEPCADKRSIHRYVNPALWAEGLGELADHRAYVRIFESGIEGEEGPDAIFDRAAAVTAAASVVARLTEPAGVIWLPACNAVPMDSFAAAMQRLLDGVAPLELWVRWFAVPPGDKEDLRPGLVTGGFAAFAGREIRAEPSEIDTRTMIDHAFALAHKLVDEKLAVSDNQLVWLDDTTGLRVRLRPAGSRDEPALYKIALERDDAAADTPPPETASARGVGTAGPAAAEAAPAENREVEPGPGQSRSAARIRVIPGGRGRN